MGSILPTWQTHTSTIENSKDATQEILLFFSSQWISKWDENAHGQWDQPWSCPLGGHNGIVHHTASAGGLHLHSIRAAGSYSNTRLGTLHFHAVLPFTLG